MAAPVQHQQPPVQPAAPQQGQQPAAPRGVGDAPSSIQSAQGANPPEKGYVETFVHWAINWIGWIFKKIFCCIFRDETPVAPPIQPHEQQGPAPVLAEQIRTEVQLLNAFGRLTEIERNRIYRRIGESVSHFWWPRQWVRSVEETGRLEVERNPLILLRYLTLNQQ
ncbi:MAG: hypothetical protein K1X28_01670 [Parachlamydiales bacterium]|nr:hypothetical protein [Parachlamydiales bacterium]